VQADTSSATVPGTVYLLHFNQRIGNPDNPRAGAQHYYGWALVLADRITCHTLGNGNSAKIIQYVQRQGIGFQIVRTWAGDRLLERALKRRKNAPQVCPVCRAARTLSRLAGTRAFEADQLPKSNREHAALLREAAWFRTRAADVLAGRRTIDDFDLESLTGAAFHECRRRQRVSPDGGRS
jgi:hypothetical protein